MKVQWLLVVLSVALTLATTSQAQETLPAPVPDPMFQEGIDDATKRKPLPPVPAPEELPPPAPKPKPEPLPPVPADEPLGFPPANKTRVEPLPQKADTAEATYLVGQADEMASLYDILLRFRHRNGQPSYADRRGHTIAMALLVVCQPDLSLERRVQLLNSVANEILSYDVPVVRNIERSGGKAVNPWLSQASAHLACKLGEQSVAQSVADFMEAHDEAAARLKIDPQLPHNLVVTAILKASASK